MVLKFQCPYCALDTAGNHAWDCPLNEDQLDLEEARKALREPGKRKTLEELMREIGIDEDT